MQHHQLLQYIKNVDKTDGFEQTPFKYACQPFTSSAAHVQACLKEPGDTSDGWMCSLTIDWLIQMSDKWLNQLLYRQFIFP